MRRKWKVLAVVLSAVIVALSIPGCGSKYRTAGKIAMKRQDWDKAIHDFKLALETDSTDAEAHRLLATCYKEKKQYELMLKHLDAADRFEPEGKDETDELRANVWTPLFNSGLDKANAKDYEGARQDFSLAAEVLPERHETYAILGFVWEQLGNDDSAYFYYDQAYRLKPDDIKVLENFAILCFNQQKYDKAESLFTRILVADPSNAEAYVRLGDIANQRKQFQKAKDYYGKALEEKPDECWWWYNVGVIDLQAAMRGEDTLNLDLDVKKLCPFLNDEKEAFSRVQKLYPDEREKARQVFDALKRYCAHLDDAERSFSRAAELCPEEMDILVNLNITLISLGKLDDATERLEIFTHKFPEECLGWDLLSQALLRKGDRKGALEANKKYEECIKQ